MTSQGKQLNIDAVRKMTQRPIALKVQAFLHIYGELAKLIENRASQGHFEIVYTIPKFVIGFPPYRELDCASYLYYRFREEGFEVTILPVHGGFVTIRVSWRMSLDQKQEQEGQQRGVDQKQRKIYNVIPKSSRAEGLSSEDQQPDSSLRKSVKKKRSTFTVKDRQQSNATTMNFLHNTGIIDELPVNKKSSIYL